MTPPAWQDNPSRFKARLPVIGLSIFGLTLAPALASSVPVRTPADWILNIAFLAAIVTGLLGSESRWRHRPWLVVLFGLSAGPLCFTGAIWSLIEMESRDTWTYLELARAAAAVLCAGPAVNETLASLQYVRRQASRGYSPWRSFWGLAEKPGRRGRVRVLEMSRHAGDSRS
jgi:hypothetical protein